jgi:hypothetical protein
VLVANVGLATQIQASEVLTPTGRWPDDQLLKEFDAARHQTRAFAAHCDRHRVQNEELMASPGSPRARQANAPAVYAAPWPNS